MEYSESDSESNSEEEEEIEEFFPGKGHHDRRERGEHHGKKGPHHKGGNKT